ncbi:MAG TPA: ankyrin repeat domain-containing protein [Candidatus Sulfotelmatobacter sp.]
MDASHAQELISATKDDDLAKVRMLLSEEPAPVRVLDEAGTSAVVLAVYHGKPHIADALVAKWKPLDIVEATAVGDLALVSELVSANRELARTYSPDGFPLVALASTFGHLEVVKLLLSHGADINAIATNGTGYTALTGAISQRHSEIALLLLAHGARADHHYGPGWTPLHHAAMDGDLEVATMLLDHGAELNARNADGNTPLSLALDKQKTEVAQMLQARGGVK